MGYFDKLVKKAGNEFSLAMSKAVDIPVNAWVDTGSLAFNALLSGSIFGGMPGNKVLALAGEESTGKSFLALGIARYFQEQNKKAGVIDFETEGALDETVTTKNMLEARGIDPTRFFLAPVSTIEDFRTQALVMLNEHAETEKEDRPPMMMILDSLGNISTNKETSDIATGTDKKDMTKQQLTKGAFRVLGLKMSRLYVPMIVTNHIYAVIGSYVPTKEMSGGGGLKYIASIIVFLSKSKAKDADKNVKGALLTARIDKSRFTKEEKKVTLLLDHAKGLDRYYGLLEIAATGGVIELVSGAVPGKPKKYKLLDGSEQYDTVIYKNPEKYFTEEFLKKIDEAAGRIFKYGSEDEVPDYSADEVDNEDDDAE